MKLSKSKQKKLKTLHVAVAILWLICVAIVTILVYISMHAKTGETLYNYTHIYHFVDTKILTPAAVLTLFTGIAYVHFTQWEYTKHKWIIYKLIVALFIIISGIFYLAPLTDNILAIVESKKILALNDAQYISNATNLFYMGTVNFFLLLSATAAAVLKPWKRHSSIR